MTYHGEEPEDKEEGGEQNGDTKDDVFDFVFPVLLVDVVWLDDLDWFYTSSPIPDFIMT
ncbi:MAG: hypothetical protein JXA00_01270 [Candidatus Thermoplasmatota archaeon]|nr:hypothetical protein [Candidatus Thermoplasmatota archaeon]